MNFNCVQRREKSDSAQISLNSSQNICLAFRVWIDTLLYLRSLLLLQMKSIGPHLHYLRISTRMLDIGSHASCIYTDLNLENTLVLVAGFVRLQTANLFRYIIRIISKETFFTQTEQSTSTL